MTMTDPIADMLCRIRNANESRLAKVELPASRIKCSIAEILKQEGFIRNFKVVDADGGKKHLKLYLRYDENQSGYVKGIHRISRPGIRRYVGYRDLPKFKSGFGVSILTTSQGLMTDYQARAKKVGGEVICSIW